MATPNNPIARLPEQREQAITLRLKDRSASVLVGEFEVKE